MVIVTKKISNRSGKEAQECWRRGQVAALNRTVRNHTEKMRSKQRVDGDTETKELDV